MSRRRLFEVLHEGVTWGGTAMTLGAFYFLFYNTPKFDAQGVNRGARTRLLCIKFYPELSACVAMGGNAPVQPVILEPHAVLFACLAAPTRLRVPEALQITESDNARILSLLQRTDADARLK